MSNLFVIFGSCLIIAVSVVNGQNASEAEVEQTNTEVPLEFRGVESRSSSMNKEVCFSVGCFKLVEPWHSKLRPLETPQSPEKINTKFYFYSRKNKMSPVTFPFKPDMDLSKSKFDSDKKTAVIVESFSNGKSQWTLEMKDAYLDKVDANVIIVDWSGGSSTVNYFQAASNARVVGKELALFFKILHKVYAADPQKFHLICHGLGAHVCSYWGKETKGLGRLTALDPAQPYFEDFPPTVRLDKTDAKFVDVIHTNAKPFKPGFGFGMIRTYGHVDFYINGGFDQPGCTPPMSEAFFKPVLANFWKYPLDMIGFWLHCDHIRAPFYFIDAIKEQMGCSMKGIVSDVKHSLDTAEVLTDKVRSYTDECNENNCLKMGLDTEKSPLRGIFVVKTKERSPFCKKPRSPGGILRHIWEFLSTIFG